MNRPIKVLESFPEPRATTNPYITQLARALRETPGVDLVTFRPAFALFGRYDVFHVHWPENLVGGHKRVGRVARRLHALALCLRLELSRTPVVRTWHNLDRPVRLSRLDNWVLDWIDRLTSLRIRLNDVTEAGDHEVVTIAHGHYRGWFEGMPTSTPRRGRVTFAGLIRPYKGVDSLISAFREMADADASLVITGKASAEDDAALRALAEGDTRVSFDLRYITEEELVQAVSSAQLVALPYRQMHNSGALLAALSLNRPVLVPETEVTRRLAEEVGDGWVIRYRGELTSSSLEAAIQSAATIGGGVPDLSARDWRDAGPAHRDAFLQAIKHARVH